MCNLTGILAIRLLEFMVNYDHGPSLNVKRSTFLQFYPNTPMTIIILDKAHHYWPGRCPSSSDASYKVHINLLKNNKNMKSTTLCFVWFNTK